MDERLSHDLEKIDKLMEATKDLALDFLNTVSQRQVAKTNTVAESNDLPNIGLGGIATLARFKSQHYDLLSGSTGPRYLGFVTGGATPASVAGDWLAGAFDQNLSNFGESVAPDLELQTINLLLDLFGLPDHFTGSFVTGATMSNFVGLAQARHWVASQAGVDINNAGSYGLAPIKILSGCVHSSIFKCLSMLGMGKNNLQVIETIPERESVNIASLEAYLKKLNGNPCIVVANAGTVNSVDFDDIAAIVALKEKYNFWLHVDAAFGGFAACSPAYQHLLNGIEQADSITIDAHKWLNVPYDCAMQFSRHPSLQLDVFQNSAAYLGDIGEQPDFVHITPENSRRFRALPVWFSLMAYGKAGYQEIVERNINCAKLLSAKITSSSEYELLAPTRLNVVCFSLMEEGIDLSTIQKFLKQLSADGKVFMTQTLYNGKPGIRAAFSNWRTSADDVEIIWESLLLTYQNFMP